MRWRSKAQRGRDAWRKICDGAGMNKFWAGLIGFGVVLGVGVMFFEHQATEELRGEVAMLRADIQRSATQRDAARREETKTVAVATVAPENSRADEDRAELARLRDEVSALKASTQEAARQAQAAAQAARGESPIPVKLIPVSELKNAGRATVPAAVETVLWAAAGGDVETLANSIQLDPSAQVKAQELFARLSEASRAQYGSPEKLVALFLAKDAAAVAGMQILGQRDVTPDVIGVRVRVSNDEGKTKEQSFGFQKTPDGLRLKVPDEFVNKYAQQLTGGAGK